MARRTGIREPVRVLQNADSIFSRISNPAHAGLLVADSTLYRETTLTISSYAVLRTFRRTPHAYFTFRSLEIDASPTRSQSQPRAQRERRGGVSSARTDGQVRFLLIRDSYKNWGLPEAGIPAITVMSVQLKSLETAPP